MATGSGAARQELFKAITEETNTGLDGGCFEAEAKRGLVEVGDDAVWSLSSAKPGFGVTQLRDNNVETYWQSDGGQPHTITMQWQRRRCVEQISFYVNYTMDESYTPHTLSVRVGTTFHDLREIKVIELEGEPSGWINVPLLDETTHRCPRTHLLQLVVVANYQNGRDTHIRQVKVFGPQREYRTSEEQALFHSEWNSTEFHMWSVLR